MKSYTDIEQSKKLAKILPIESADMWFHPYPNDEYWYDIPNIGNADLKFNQLPCWSLAALLDFLAQQDCFPEITYTGTCYLMDINFYDDEDGKTIHPIHFIRSEGNTLIDAVIELIYKLKDINYFKK